MPGAAMVVLLLLALPSGSPLPGGARVGSAGHDLVDVARVVPDAVVDLRYATPDNLLGRALYPAGARCLLRAPVADRVARAAARLRPHGLRLLLWDCFRPISVQREMWRRFTRPGYVADPAKGSNHNRGAAVDLGLAARDGGPVPLPTGFDTFSPLARARATGLPPDAARNRDLLRAAMEAEGFRVNPMEWWHFDAPEARGAPLLDAELR